METKIKITFFDTYNMNLVAAKICKIYGWNDLQNQLQVNNIIETSIIKIEIVLEASIETTEDTTTV